jgi:hypothetical protein
MVELYLHSPICLQSVVLNQLKPRVIPLPYRPCHTFFISLSSDALNVDDRVINEYEAIGGMRIGRGNSNKNYPTAILSAINPT